MKKFLSILMAAVILLSGIVFASAKDNTQLQFGDDGKFEILIFADIQSGYPVGDALTAFIAEALDEANPDLVVFLGDNIMKAEDGTTESYLKGYDEVLPLLEEREIPFTLVFGNHDYEVAPLELRDNLLAIYQKYDGCLAYDAAPSLHGCGTHNLPILSSDETKTAYNLWFFDSGDYVYNEDGSKKYYDCVRADQIEWYKNKSNELKAANGGELVPSLAFQHIIPQEVTQTVMFSLPFQLGKITKNFTDGTSVTYLPNYFAFEGILSEIPCPSQDNEGQWDAFVEQGDVKACFFGHDHVNGFIADVDGVDGVNVPGSTFKSYRSTTDQGAMLVTLDESDLSTYSTEMIYVSELATREGSNIPNQEHSESVVNYKFRTFLRKLAHGILDLLRAAYKALPGLIEKIPDLIEKLPEIVK